MGKSTLRHVSVNSGAEEEQSVLVFKGKGFQNTQQLFLFSCTDTAQGWLCCAQDVQGVVMLLLMFESVLLGPC